MSIFYTKLINFEQPANTGKSNKVNQSDTSGLFVQGRGMKIEERRNIKVSPGYHNKDEDNRDEEARKIGRERFRRLGARAGDGTAASKGLRDAQRELAPLTQTVKDIINEIDREAEVVIFNLPRAAKEEPIDLTKPDDDLSKPNPKLEISFPIPGEARGVGPSDKKYYMTNKMDKTAEIELEGEAKEKLKVFYGINSALDDNMQLTQNFMFQLSLKEHLSTSSKAMTDLLEGLRNFQSKAIPGGIRCRYDKKNGELVISFSSTKSIYEELDKLSADTKENKELLSELGKELFGDPDPRGSAKGNLVIKEAVKEFAENLENEIMGKEDENTKKRTEGKLQEYMEKPENQNIIQQLIQAMITKNPKLTRDEALAEIKEKIEENFQKEVQFRKDLYKLHLFKNELLKSGTGLDGILERIFKVRIAGNINNQFKEIMSVLSRTGLKVNPNELLGKIEGGFDKEEKRSVNPMVSYAHMKINKLDEMEKAEFESDKIAWEKNHPGEKYPHEYKDTLQQIKEAMLNQLEKQIEDKSQNLQEVYNERSGLKAHLEKELKLNGSTVGRSIS